MNNTCENCDALLLRNEISAGYSRLNLFHSVFLALICLVGTFGNTLVLFITRNKQPKQNKNPDLVAIILLALTDLFVCLFLVPYEIYHLQENFSQTSPVLCKSFSWMRSSTMMLTCFVLFIIAVERCKTICSVQRQSLHFVKKLRTALVASVGLSLVTASPVLILIGIQVRPIGANMLSKFGLTISNETELLLKISTISSCEYLDVYNGAWSVQLFGMFFLSLFIVLIIITLICYGRIYLFVNRVAPFPRQVWPLQSNLARRMSRRRKTTNRQTPGSTPLVVGNVNRIFAVGEREHEVPSVAVIYNRDLLNPDRIANTRTPITITRTPRAITNIPRAITNTPMAITSTPIANTSKQKPACTFMSSNRRKQILVCKLLFLVTGFFILSWTPFWVLSFCNMFIHNLDSILTETQSAIVAILYNLFYLNNAANPILYAIYSPRFRLQCQAIFKSFGRRVNKGQLNL